MPTFHVLSLRASRTNTQITMAFEEVIALRLNRGRLAPRLAQLLIAAVIFSTVNCKPHNLVRSSPLRPHTAQIPPTAHLHDPTGTSHTSQLLRCCDDSRRATTTVGGPTATGKPQNLVSVADPQRAARRPCTQFRAVAFTHTSRRWWTWPTTSREARQDCFRVQRGVRQNRFRVRINSVRLSRDTTFDSAVG